MKNRGGQRVPDVTFKTRANGELLDVTTDDIFKGKTVAVFEPPGAFTFTPTCSSTHALPAAWLIAAAAVLAAASTWRPPKALSHLAGRFPQGDLLQ